MIAASAEALRIVRSVIAEFPSGPNQTGSAFLAPVRGRLVTCAHVVVNDAGQQATRVRVLRSGQNASVVADIDTVDRALDLATLEIDDGVCEGPSVQMDLPDIGEPLVFAGLPQGVAISSVFPGMVSAVGSRLIASPRCDLIQVAGMINNGNSGGPLLNETGQIVGIITAKYVPLLVEIDKLRTNLAQIPQFPSDVGIGQVDFAQFVNLTIRSMWQMSAVLRLVQVGTGWAVPVKYFSKVGAL